MNAERWRVIEDLFNQALEAAPADRDTWLRKVCADDEDLRLQVISLLESDQKAGGFLAGSIESAVVSAGTEARAPAPLSAGPYKLLEEIGRGGMGTVYLGTRQYEGFEKKVAVKVVRPDFDTDFILKRFRRERQILARMEHPNIARLLDFGNTPEGVPYLVMEYIDGCWITQYCDRNKLNVEQRLRLFLQVCSAVEHAHQHFIVHRDLKPGNILVDKSGTPKLLDFGISKLLFSDVGDVTHTQGMQMMTPDYASPEQVTGEAVTVASDIYSLGAVLYKLLSGAGPHRIGKYTPFAIEEAICRQDITRASSAAGDRALKRALSGDLDTILSRALEKEPGRRYPSVQSFGDDIRRHLDKLPITARPQTIRYRAVKFARRNTGTIAALVSTMLALSAGLVLAMRQANSAEQRFQQIRRLANVFVFDVHDAIAQLPGATRARLTIVRTGLDYLDQLSKDAAGDPALRQELAAAYMRLGEIQGSPLAANLGDSEGALASFRKAIGLLEAMSGTSPDGRKAQVNRIRAHQLVGDILVSANKSARALEEYNTALRIGEQLKLTDDSELGWRLGTLHMSVSRLQRSAGDHAGAVSNAARGVVLLRTQLQAKPGNREFQNSLASALSNLGVAQVRVGKHDEALSSYREAAEMTGKLAAAPPPSVPVRRQLMLVHGHIGDLLTRNLGDREGGLDAYRQATAIAKELHEADAADLRSLGDYAIATMRVAGAMPEDHDSARAALYRDSLRLLRQVEKASPRNVSNRDHIGYVEYRLGAIAADAGDHKEAMRRYAISRASAEALLAESPSQWSSRVLLVDVAVRLVPLMVRSGDIPGATRLAEQAMQVAEAGFKLQAAQSTADSRTLMAQAYSAMRVFYSARAQSAGPAGEQARFREAAIDWHGRSIAMWREAEKLPGFSERYRKEYEREARWDMKVAEAKKAR